MQQLIGNSSFATACHAFAPHLRQLVPRQVMNIRWVAALATAATATRAFIEVQDKSKQKCKSSKEFAMRLQRDSEMSAIALNLNHF